MTKNLDQYFDNITVVVGDECTRDLAISLMCMMVGAATLSRVISKSLGRYAAGSAECHAAAEAVGKTFVDLIVSGAIDPSGSVICGRAGSDVSSLK